MAFVKRQKTRKEREIQPKKITIGGMIYWRVRLGKKRFGKPSSKSFKNLAEAETYLAQQLVKRENEGTAASSLSDHRRLDAVAALKIITTKLAHVPEADRPTLRDLAEDYVRRHAPHGSILTKDAVDFFIISRKEKECSPTYMVALRRDLRLVEEAWGKLPFHAITAAMVREFLGKPRWATATKNSKRCPTWSVRTKNNMRTTLAALWAHGAAKSRGWTAENIVLEIPRFKEIREAPGILTLEQTRTLLEGACEHAPELVPLLAIQAFAGLRRSEALALDWNEINFEKKDIHVSGAKSKTASWRLAPMPGNLIEWLTASRQPSGPIVPWHDLKGGKMAIRHTASIEGHRRRELMAKIGMKSLPKNGLRHTAATYRLAALGDPARVATELGHSQKILLAHYRILARQEDAEKYFAIIPTKG